MDDDLVVTVGGLSMYGRPGLGPFTILEKGLDGWDDGVVMRGDKTAQPQKHGSRTVPRFQESRTVTITGLIIASSPQELGWARNRLAGVLAGGGIGRIQVARSADVQWADASLDQISIDPRRGARKADFQIQLWCPDARKFGEMHTYAASVGSPATAFHLGNYVAMPRFTVAGSMPGGYTLWIQGVPFVVTRPLVSGAPHTIDYNDGRLRIGGGIIHGGLGVTNTLGIQPGGTALVEITPVTTGTGTASMTLLDTYI
jgi:hypothetical protein